MAILVLDSAFKPTVCVIDKQAVVLTKVSENQNHSDNFMLLIDAALKEANLKLENIDTIMLNIGPGSFTGLRVGVSISKGLGFGDDKKFLVFSSFDYIKTDKEILVPAFSNFVYKKNSKNQMSCEDIASLDKSKEYVTTFLELKEKLLDLGFSVKHEERLSYLEIYNSHDKKYLKVNELEPLYLRKSQAEIDKESKK